MTPLFAVVRDKSKKNQADQAVRSDLMNKGTKGVCIISKGKSSPSSHLGWNVSALTRFQRLIIVKVLRPERLVDSVRMFVEEQMGSKFVTSVGFDLQEIFEESNNRKPLIFILSPGKSRCNYAGD